MSLMMKKNFQTLKHILLVSAFPFLTSGFAQADIIDDMRHDSSTQPQTKETFFPLKTILVQNDKSKQRTTKKIKKHPCSKTRVFFSNFEITI